MSEKITIEALVGAAPDLVWQCYTQPEHITSWNFASPDWHCPSAENDLRPGGRYNARMEAKDGGFGFDLGMTHDEVVPGRKLVSRMDDDRMVEVEFIPEGSDTRVRTTFDAESQNPAEMQRQGWQAILDSFKGYVERL
ncbi:SRPBCC family protein [Albibacillus kandeliae]|uniref:SRPBCC family protein n=1 Tax=Albibacillus kandeliae TaxID=2174228 RepID=UPI000D697C49|nr:SRPBCC family protein [Albibacillus kandeliae]